MNKIIICDSEDEADTLWADNVATASVVFIRTTENLRVYHSRVERYRIGDVYPLDHAINVEPEGYPEDLLKVLDYLNTKLKNDRLLIKVDKLSQDSYQVNVLHPVCPFCQRPILEHQEMPQAKKIYLPLCQDCGKVKSPVENDLTKMN